MDAPSYDSGQAMDAQSCDSVLPAPKRKQQGQECVRNW